jgi:glycerate 2-kinase
MNIVVSTGSFKDIYSPIELCEIIKNSLESFHINKLTIKTLPMADGGEYSNDVLSNNMNHKKIFVDNVIDPSGETTKSYYIKLDNTSAFIGSSEIIGLPPEKEKLKNPLKLTSYGLGQLIIDAINKKFKNIYVGLGGTSTVDGGIGILQAFNVNFFDKLGKKLEPIGGGYFSGQDLINISQISSGISGLNLEKINLIPLCDAKINLEQMSIPNNQKISTNNQKERDFILSSLQNGVFSYAKVVEKNMQKKTKGIELNIFKKEFVGCAGGMLLGLHSLFDIKPVSGFEYFRKKFHLDNSINKANLVITGEGKFDNISLDGKTPVGISRIAKQHNKRVLYICGDIALPIKKSFNGFNCSNLPSIFIENGIDSIISLHHYYDQIKLPNNYVDRVEIYRNKNPEQLTEALRLFFNSYDD